MPTLVEELIEADDIDPAAYRSVFERWMRNPTVKAVAERRTTFSKETNIFIRELYKWWQGRMPRVIDEKSKERFRYLLEAIGGGYLLEDYVNAVGNTSAFAALGLLPFFEKEMRTSRREILRGITFTIVSAAAGEGFTRLKYKDLYVLTKNARYADSRYVESRR